MAPAVRLFLCHLIDLSTTVRKLHHHISLNALARADVMWWDSFLPSRNGVAIFVEPDKTEADSLQLFTDASGSLGFGTYFNGGWFRGDWQPHQYLPLCTIQWLELFTIMAVASTWGPLWTGLRIHFHCDNLPISRPGQDSPQNSLDSCNCSKPCALGQPSTVSPSTFSAT